MKKVLVLCLIAALVLSSAGYADNVSAAKSGPSLSAKKKTLELSGSKASFTLKVKKSKKGKIQKTAYKLSGKDAKIIKLSKKKKTSVKVTAVKAGTATLKAVVNYKEASKKMKKTLKCKITVNDNAANNGAADNSNTNQQGQNSQTGQNTQNSQGSQSGGNDQNGQVQTPQPDPTATPRPNEKIEFDIYVSQNGDDNSIGTKNYPFKTVARAQEEVRRMNLDMTHDITVHIADGDYELEDTLEITDEDNGTNGYKVIYEGAGRESTILSGGSKLTGWTLHDESKNIYKATVPAGTDFRQLYVNGYKATRARSGKIGTYDTRIIGAERIKDGEVLPELLVEDSARSKQQADDGTIFISKDDNTFDTSWDDYLDVELHILTAWSTNVLRVKSAELSGNQYNIKIHDEEALLLFNRQHPNIDGYSHMSTRRFVYYTENAYELIDENNEWYLDKKTNTVYLKAEPGVDPEECEIIFPRLENIVRISGDNDYPVMNITFRNMGFMYSTWMKPSEEGFVDGQAMQYVTKTIFSANDVGVGRPSAGIVVTGANNITFDNDFICNMGATGIDFFWGVSDSTISNCLITDMAGNGIQVGKFVEDDVIDFHVPYNPEDERDICTNDVVFNNEIYYIGTDYECAVAITCGYPRGILIANNTIEHAPYSGISVGFGWTKSRNAMSGNRILNNDIGYVTEILCDAGGIYTLSDQPDSEMTGNYIHDIVLPSWADYGTSGIYLDEGTGGYLVENNVIEKAYDINSHMTGTNTIRNNVISTGSTANSENALRIKDAAGVHDDVEIEDYY